MAPPRELEAARGHSKMDRSKIARLALLLLPFLVSLACAEEPPRASELTHTGILYGYIADVAPDFSWVFLQPIEKGTKRRRIFLDKRTEVRVENKKKPKSELYVGDKIAVRYLGKGEILLADAVFVVFGEFEPKDYVKKKKLIVVQKGGEGKGEEKKGGH